MLTDANVASTVADYVVGLDTIGASVAGRTGLALLHALKREAAGITPYPHVSLSEAANRIMSDLVILYGVQWLLSTRALPFSSYEVELGNENNNGFDIRASNMQETLADEAFNVAPSFFFTKKSSAVRKLRQQAPTVTYRLLMFNADARSEGYVPRLESDLLLMLVDVETGTARLLR